MVAIGPFSLARKLNDNPPWKSLCLLPSLSWENESTIIFQQPYFEDIRGVVGNFVFQDGGR